MSVETIGIAVLVVLLFFFCSTIWKIRRIRKMIGKAALPEPAGAWPLLGHLPMLSDPAIPHKVLGDLADKYGPAFLVRLGFYNALVVSSSDVAKECFTTNDRNFATRPASTAVKIMAYNYAVFGFGPYGLYWREIRKIAILELLSNHRLQLLKDIRVSEVRTSISDLHQICQEKKCNDSYQPVLVEMKHWFSDSTLNVIVRMVAGKRYESASNAKLQVGDEGDRLQTAVKEYFRLVGLFIVGDAIPCLGWLDFKGHVKAMKRNAKEIDNIMGGWLEEHRRCNSSGESKIEKDFMCVMLSILEDEKFFQYETDTVTKAMCFQMIIAAFDTTTLTLTWALSMLLNDRHVLKNAQDEIDNIIGKDRQVEESDIEKLVYLQAIVKETLRLYPAAPLSVQHEAIEDCTVAGYHIPSGTRLITNLSKMQRDPNIWTNPNEFKPERFLTTQAKVGVRGNHFELIPFGSGRRSCPGISFALQVIHLFLAHLLQGFDFETPANAPVDMTEGVGLTNLKATPLEVLITPRLPPNLY